MADEQRKSERGDGENKKKYSTGKITHGEVGREEKFVEMSLRKAHTKRGKLVAA